MSTYSIWVLLFLGNVALMFLWVHYIIRVLLGQCPNCGNQRKAPLAGVIGSLRNQVTSVNDDGNPAPHHKW